MEKIDNFIHATRKKKWNNGMRIWYLKRPSVDDYKIFFAGELVQAFQQIYHITSWLIMTLFYFLQLFMLFYGGLAKRIFQVEKYESLLRIIKNWCYNLNFYKKRFTTHATQKNWKNISFNNNYSDNFRIFLK